MNDCAQRTMIPVRLKGWYILDDDEDHSNGVTCGPCDVVAYAVEMTSEWVSDNDRNNPNEYRSWWLVILPAGARWVSDADIAFNENAANEKALEYGLIEEPP